MQQFKSSLNWTGDANRGGVYDVTSTYAEQRRMFGAEAAFQLPPSGYQDPLNASSILNFIPPTPPQPRLPLLPTPPPPPPPRLPPPQMQGGDDVRPWNLARLPVVPPINVRRSPPEATRTIRYYPKHPKRK